MAKDRDRDRTETPASTTTEPIPVQTPPIQTVTITPPTDGEITVSTDEDMTDRARDMRSDLEVVREVAGFLRQMNDSGIIIAVKVTTDAFQAVLVNTTHRDLIESALDGVHNTHSFSARHDVYMATAEKPTTDDRRTRTEPERAMSAT